MSITINCETEGDRIKRIVKVMEEGYAGFLPGGVIVDVRDHPEARPAPGPDGRNAAAWLKEYNLK